MKEGDGMNLGKVPETVLKRSVLKKIKHRRRDVLEKAGVGKDTGSFLVEEESQLVFSTNPISGTPEQISFYGVPNVVNNLVADGAEPVGLLVSLLLPENGKEDEIKIVMEGLENQCEKLQMEIITGHTGISDGISQIIVTLTGIGVKRKISCSWEPKKIQENYQLVMTKWCGLSGTVCLAQDYREELCKRFTSNFLEEAEQFSQYAFVIEEAGIAREMGAAAMHDVNEGGIFAALWELASREDIGFKADLKKMLIRQETIEVCEYFDINPYRLKGCGSLLVVIENGNAYVERLKQLGIEAAVIGRVVKGNDRLICNEEEEQYLEPPKGDACYLVKERMKEVSERRKRACAMKF